MKEQEKETGMRSGNASQKGTYGYRNRRTFRKAVISALILALLVGQVYASRKISGTLGTLLLITGILTVLPLANTLSPLLAMGHYRTPSRDFYESMRPYESRGVMLYDLVFPTEEKAFASDALLIRNGAVMLYVPDRRTGIASSAKTHLERQLRLGKTPCRVNVYTDPEQFRKALDRLPDYDGRDPSGQDLAAAETLRRVSY